ncbi:MAG: CRISPR-associated helicase Cas3' [Chthoniobacterales bacterium]|nr:CRISPR-associated helicase Cas3' [Chthoniobacterales bacterium]
MTFDQFFKTAFGLSENSNVEPFDYQRRLAEGVECRSRLIDIPTGLGKTVAVVLAWLWNRVEKKRATWPRRLVYCLPMRTLVEQTRDNVKQWLAAIGLSEKVGLHILMGGEERETDPWDIHPEHNAILIGTQDMLLSRALNRGYGMSRYRWPMHFGLLNNDALWIMDEVQLMGAGLPTTSQLAQFREEMETMNGSLSWWMSATLRPDWLATIDFKPDKLAPPLTLSATDISQAEKLLNAQKPVTRADNSPPETKKLASKIINARADDGITLVVVNTVERACLLHAAIGAAQKKAKSALPAPVLIHSRFRPDDRRARVGELLALEGKPGIVVSTQVVEAGVDVSAKVLFTELAPWPSLVQRFGRCNRRGRDREARIIWIDFDESKFAAPYCEADLARARSKIIQLADAAPAKLAESPIDAADRPSARHVLRRKDFIELFDTTPDLAGNDLDIDRFIRDADDRSVQVFWRQWEQKWPAQSPARKSSAAAAPERKELCPVPINSFREFIENGTVAFQWDYLEREWRKADSQPLVPGHNYLLHVSCGGYSELLGWNPKLREEVKDLRPPDEVDPPDANDSDDLSEKPWESIAQHTDKVVGELALILEALNPPHRSALEVAARWHDWGKAHEVFQNAIKLNRDSELRPEAWRERRDIAKAPGKNKRTGDPGWWSRYEKKHFRHEMASALAILQPSVPITDELRNLVAYLIAAHHGKVRLSLRSLPDERTPTDFRRFARGVWQGDELPAVDLGGGVIAPNILLSLEPMELGECEEEPFAGEPSWIERVLRLRDSLGPFRLAYYESLLRAADERGSEVRP